MGLQGTVPVRNTPLWSARVDIDRRADGTIRLTSPDPLPPYPDRITDRLVAWARDAPDRLYLTEVAPDGGRRGVTYAEALERVRRIGSALLRRGLSVDRPVMILSGNDIPHALLTLAAMYVGVPVAPVSTAYSLVATDYDKVAHIFATVTPGLVFAADGGRFSRAIRAVIPADIELVVVDNPLPDRPATRFADLEAGPIDPAVDLAHAAVGPGTIAKFLFTSGSTGLPKAVINTQRMLTANQVMIRAALPFLAEEPPVIVDWLPWNHTFGGNHNMGIALYNGGTFHIDAGKPVAGGIEATVRALRDIAPTLYFNVPKGYESLLPYLRQEPDLARRFFSRLRMTFFAGASLAQHVWDGLDEAAAAACGETIMMMSSLGSTETAPAALFCTRETLRAGAVGIPLPGVELKLVPNQGKLEARLRGPNITPGYWRQPELTAKAFDEEGFYLLGDALRFVDPDEPRLGFIFDGRVAEDFKLATGTWVSVGPLRIRIVQALAPFVRDAVIAGHDRDEVGALLVVEEEPLRALVPDLSPTASLAQVLAAPPVRAMLQQRLDALFAAGTGSATRLARMIALDAPLSIDANEITDKGSINQRAVLATRTAIVEDLYAAWPPAHVLIASGATGD